MHTIPGMRPQPPSPQMSGAVVALWADEALRNTRAVVHALEHLGFRVLLVSLPPSFVGGQLQLSARAPPEGIVSLIGLGVDADAAFLHAAATLTTLESVVLCLPPRPPRSAVGRLRTLALVGESLAIESPPQLEGELRIETSHWTVDGLVCASAEEISREMRRVAQWICNEAEEEVAFREMGGLPPPEALQGLARGVPIRGLSQADSGRSFIAARSRADFSFVEEEEARARAEAEVQERARAEAEQAARARAEEEEAARARAEAELQERARAEAEEAARVSAEAEEAARARAEAELQERARAEAEVRARARAAEESARASAAEELRERARAAAELRARARAEEEAARARAAEELRARAREGADRRARARAEEEAARARAEAELQERARAAAELRERARAEAELREQEEASARAEEVETTPASSCSEDLSTSFSSSCSLQSASLPSPSSVSCRDPSPQSPAPPCSSQSSSSSPSSALTVSIGASPRSAASRCTAVQSQRKNKRAPSGASPSPPFRFAVTGPKDRVYLLPSRMFILQVWAMLAQSFDVFSQTLQLLRTNEELVGGTSTRRLDPSERTLRVCVRVDECTVDPPEETLTLDDDSALKSTRHEVSVPEEYTRDSLRCVVEIRSVSSSSRSIFSSSFTLGATNREPSGADSSAVAFVHHPSEVAVPSAEAMDQLPSEAIVRQPSALEIAMQPSASEIAELLIFASTTASAPLPSLSREVCEVGLASCWATKLSFLCGGTLEDLAVRFRQHPVRRFLFSGHTNVMEGMSHTNVMEGMRTLSFTSPGGVLSQVSGTDFVGLLGQHSEGRLNEEGNVGALRLVFLNCCHGEQMARAICEAGVACVVCWRGKVLDQAAQHFARCFFAVDARLSGVRSQSDAHPAFSPSDLRVAFSEAWTFVESQRLATKLHGNRVEVELVLEDPQAASTESQLNEGRLQVGAPLMLLREPSGEVVEIRSNEAAHEPAVQNTASSLEAAVSSA